MALPRMQEVGRPIRAFYTKNKLMVSMEDKADKADRLMISTADKEGKSDKLEDQKVKSKHMVDKADIAPDPEVSMDSLKTKEIIGRDMETSNIDLDTEVSKSKGKGEENLKERGRKKEVLLSVSTDRGMPTVSKDLADLPQCTPVLPTRPRTRPPTTRFPSSRTVRRRRLRR